MKEALVAIGLLAVLAAGGWYAYARARERGGELWNENKALRKGAEVLDEVVKILATPVAFGGKLRAGLRARARRHELSESDDLTEASALAGDDPESDRRDDLDS